MVTKEMLDRCRKLICLPFNDEGHDEDSDSDEDNILGDGHVLIPLLHGNEQNGSLKISFSKEVFHRNVYKCNTQQRHVFYK